MPVLDRGYRSKAHTELERDVREIEAQSKVAKTKDEAWQLAAAMQAAVANINFAERIRLITAEQAGEYKERIQKAAEEFQRQRADDAERIDTASNDRGMTVEEWRREVERTKARDAEKNREQEQRSAGERSIPEEDEVRTK